MMEDDELLAELTAAFTQGIAAPLEQRQIIGKFFGGDLRTTAETPRNVTRDSIRGGATVYYVDDEVDVVRAMNEEQLARFQDSIVSLGLVSDVVPGRLDDNTFKGMATLMALGNRQAVEWTTVLDGLVASGQSASKQVEIAPYRPPDHASVAQDVKSYMTQRLKRDPTRADMQLMVDELYGDYRAQYDADVQAAQGNHDVTVAQVDPVARFQQAFEDRYSGEIAQMELKQEVQSTAAEAQSQVDTIGRITGV